MKWTEFIHLMRATHNVTKRKHFVIVGSQSIIGNKDWSESLPSEITGSVELDIIIADAPATFDEINGALGEFSRFHASYGYYADGIDLDTIRLPEGYLDRTTSLDVDLQDAEHTTVEVEFISLEDAIACKIYAGRDKDRDYIKSVKENFDVEHEKLIECLDEISEGDFDLFSSLLNQYEAL